MNNLDEKPLVKYRELQENELLEINDFVVVQSILGRRQYKITRLTKTLAVCKCNRSTKERPNDFIDIRFNKRYGFGFGFYPRDTWDSNAYRVYRKVI